MKLLDQLNRKIGRYAIRNLMLYIIVLNVAAFIFLYTAPELGGKLALNPYLIRQGEIWRLITFVAYPPSSSPLFLAFALYLYYMIGNTLENQWGSFKFNVYYLLGVLGIIASAFISNSVIGSAFYLNLSLFLAFARLYPNFTLMIFFVLPVKMKWLAWFNWALFGLQLIQGSAADRAAIIATLLNYFIFFGKDIVTNTKSASTGYYRKKAYQSNMKSVHKEYHHKCTVCGRTELDDKDLEFRYCSKCDGYHEYCMDHLHDHEHIKGDDQV